MLRSTVVDGIVLRPGARNDVPMICHSELWPLLPPSYIFYHLYVVFPCSFILLNYQVYPTHRLRETYGYEPFMLLKTSTPNLVTPCQKIAT